MHNRAHEVPDGVVTMQYEWQFRCARTDIRSDAVLQVGQPRAATHVGEQADRCRENSTLHVMCGQCHAFKNSERYAMYVPVSGMAKTAFSVAMRNSPKMEIPTPPPITNPSHTDTCGARDSASM